MDRPASDRPSGPGHRTAAAAGPPSCRTDRTDRTPPRDLQAQIRSRATVGQALGILMERYRLPGQLAAFGLLRSASQQHNVKLRVLAGAVISAPRPPGRTGLWFPGRVRTPCPRPGFLRGRRAAAGNRAAVLAAAAAEACAVADTACAEIHLADLADRTLVLEAERGMPPEVLDHFTVSGPAGLPYPLAWREGRRVVVDDVLAHPGFAAGRAREVLAAAGIRTMQSTPLGGERCGLGTVSTHGSVPGSALGPRAAGAMDRLAREIAGWLGWYRRNVVLDALEDLHRQATAVRGTRAAGSARPV